MASRRRKERRAKTREALKQNQSEKSASVSLPINKIEEDKNKNDPLPNAKQANNKKKLSLGKLLASTTLGMWIFTVWGIATNGFYGFFADKPGLLLYPSGLLTCSLIAFGAHHLIDRFRLHKILYLLPAILSIFIMVLVHKAVAKKDLESKNLLAEQKQSTQNVVETREGISDIKTDIKKILEEMRQQNQTNEFDTNSFPGIGFAAVVRLDKLIPDRTNYIFDFKDKTSNRISLYLLPDKSLCFGATAQDLVSYSVNAYPRFDTFRFHSLMFLVCDVANAGDKSFMRMFVNGHQIGLHTHPGLASFHPDPTNLWRAVVGADINHNNGSAMTIEYFAIFDSVLTKQKQTLHLQDVDTFLIDVQRNDLGFVIKGNGGLDCGIPYGKAFGDWELNPGFFSVTNGLFPSLSDARVWLF